MLKQHISVRQSDVMSSISQRDAAGHKLLSQRRHTAAPGSAGEMNITKHTPNTARAIRRNVSAAVVGWEVLQQFTHFPTSNGL